MKYAKFERLMLLVVVVAVAVMAVSMLVRKTDGVEVVGHLLMIAVILSSLYGGKTGALLGFLASAALYIAIRLVWRDGFDYGVIIQLTVAKIAVYGVLSLICAYLRTQFRYLFVKLESQDLVDDETQLGNHRFLFRELDYRVKEWDRYQKPFSLVSFSFDQDLLRGSKKRGFNVLRDVSLGVLKSDTRSVDELARVGSELHALLPNVGREGARACATRLEAKIRSYLERAAGGGLHEDSLSVSVLSYPEDREAVEGLLSRLREMETS